MVGREAADPAGISPSDSGRYQLSPTLRAYLSTWQPRQRRTAGLQAALFNRLDTLARAHPEWESYDLLTHVLGAMHLIIENDRLTGGNTRVQIIEELSGLVALEQQGDPPELHRAIAEALIDLLLNAKGRYTRVRDRYVMVDAGGTVTHPEQSFHFVRTVGDDTAAEPTLRATPEAINIFQNLFEFDPSDRAAAERYRSERMLQRRDYDEVLSSVDRRATGIHGLRSDLEQLLRRISYNVRDVAYAGEVIPRLDEALVLVHEQVEAEERFAEAVSDHAHHDAPDLEGASANHEPSSRPDSLTDRSPSDRCDREAAVRGRAGPPAVHVPADDHQPAVRAARTPAGGVTGASDRATRGSGRHVAWRPAATGAQPAGARRSDVAGRQANGCRATRRSIRARRRPQPS